MAGITRRTVLGWTAAAPFLPNLLLQPAQAASHEGRVVIVVRLMGGNDGLNTLIPVRDDRYYRARPTIAISGASALALPGGDLALHPALRDFRELMDEGLAGIVQGVGYPQSSRSHLRSTQIWETGSISDPAPAQGWLGHYLDGGCDCTGNPVAGIQFTDAAARTLASKGDNSRMIGHPGALLDLDIQSLADFGGKLPSEEKFSAVGAANQALLDATRQLKRAAKGSGGRFAYPDTAFGQALRWTGNMIETACPTRVYYLRAGSFESGASSFDTHLDQLATHEQLYSELGKGLRALCSHLASRAALSRVVLLTFSDFGRQLEENRTRGTEHGEASVVLYAGGAIHPGVRGQMPDLANLSQGGLRYNIDFRAIYADVLESWLGARPGLLPDGNPDAFPVVRT